MVNDTLEEKEIKENKKKLPKEISQEILKKMFKNLLKAIGIMFYFIILNLAYSTMKQERLIGDIEVFAGAFLIVGMIFLEKAYKKDNGSIAVSGIEFLVLSLHSLSIMHVITLFKYDFRLYLLTSSYVFSIYYVLKAIILYTKGRREYLNSLSDISEIVKKDEPIIKEAKKRNSEENLKRRQKETKESELKVEDKKVTEQIKRKKAKTKTENVAKSKSAKKKTEEMKIPEKKKRGRPKKEVTKND